MFKLCFLVPDEYVEEIKQRLFAKGAGKTRLYDQCCWQTEGISQFRPLKASDPFQGVIGRLEQINEVKVEMICHPACLIATVKELLLAHPYQQPAYEIYQIMDLADIEKLFDQG